MITVHSDPAFVFTSADVSCDVGKLLSRADLVKIAEAKSMKHALELLRDFGYNDGKDMDTEKGFNYYIDQEQLKYHKLINEIVFHREELRLFLIPRDYHNLKVIIKAEFLDIDPEPLMVETGSFGIKELIGLVKGRNYMFFSAIKKRAIMEATETFSKTGDPQEIDIIFDKACWAEMYEAAKRNGAETLVDEVDEVTDIEEPFMVEYVRKKIDLNNLDAFLRLKYMKRPKDFYKKVFLPEGNVSWNTFSSVYDEPMASLGDALAPYGYKYIIDECGKEIMETGSFAKFEELYDNNVIRMLREEKYEPYGIASTVAFLLSKDDEIRQLRMIFTWLHQGRSAKEIGESLRDSYV